MKKHTTYYIIGAVLIGVGAYLYGKKKNETKVSINLNPPAEVKEEKSDSKEMDSPPIANAVDAIKKLLDSLKLSKQTTNNQTV